MKLLLSLSVAVLFATLAFAAENELNFMYVLVRFANLFFLRIFMCSFSGMIPPASSTTGTCPACTPSAAGKDAAFCTTLLAKENAFSNLLYNVTSSNGAALPPQDVDWDAVNQLVGTNFTTYDESGVITDSLSKCPTKLIPF